jgi:hypothetical protein
MQASIAEAVYFPVDKQSRYADIVCAFNAENVEFSEDQMKYMGEDDFDKWNLASLGNMAYMSLHAHLESHRKAYDKIRKRYCLWVRERQRRQLVASIAVGIVIGGLITYALVW